MFKIQMTNDSNGKVSFFHCGRPVMETQALQFRRKKDAEACITRNPVTGWTLKAVRA
jgi:hypothetical protein